MRNFFFILLVLFAGCRDVKYPSGRDTIKSFGDGRFQVLRVKGNKRTLYDVQQQQTIARSVEKWKVVENHICTLDHASGAFVVVDLKTGICRQYGNVENAPVELRSALEALRE